MIEIRPIKPNEKEQAKYCINRSFSKDPTNPQTQEFFLQFQFLPMDRDDLFWAVFNDNLIVCAVMLVPFQIKIGEMSLSLIGLTGLGTDPDHRRKGYASQLLKKLHEYFQNEGFDGMILHSGMDALYMKNGYEFSFCTWGAIIKIEALLLSDVIDELDLAPTPILDVEVIHKDKNNIDNLDEYLISQLYNVWKTAPNRCKRELSLIRSKYYFENKLRMQLTQNHYLIVLKEGERILAYALVKTRSGDSQYEVYEMYSNSDSKLHYFKLMLTISSIDAAPNVSIFIDFYHEDKNLIELLESLDPKIFHNLLPKNMANLFDHWLILQKMQPTFILRMDNLEYEGDLTFNSSCIIQVENGYFEFNFSRSMVSIKKVDVSQIILQDKNNLIKLTHHEFIALVFGYVLIEEIEPEGYLNLSLLNKNILNTIFPAIEPIWDYFATY